MKQYISMLTSSGLNNYEAKVYYALLKNRNITASEIAKIASVPRSKVYDVLDNLIAKGLCSTLIGSVKKYNAINPETSFETMINEVEEKKKVLQNTSRIMKNLFDNAFCDFSPLDYVEVLRDKKAVHDRLYSLSDNAQSEILNMVKPPYLSPVQSTDVDTEEETLDVYYLYEYEKGISEDFLRFMQQVESTGANIRLCEKVPMKIVVVDQSVIVLALQEADPANQAFSTVFIKHPQLAGFIREMFMIYFNKSITIAEYKQMYMEG